MNERIAFMSQYTELFNIKAETLSPDDDGYEESLLEVSALFCGFDEALTVFIEEHGYTGDLDDVPAKVQFLYKKFKTANVKMPRDFKKWFVPNKKLARKTAFQICFAFGLGVDETNDFFRCVQFERGLDCHTIIEAVYYFCMRNGLSYIEAQEIIDHIHVPEKARTIPNHEVLYTETIIENINNICDKEKLICYIENNINDFKYNNATAIKYIQELWNEISKADGLAVKEGKIIDKARNWYEKDKNDKYVVVDSNASTWTIFSQIMGLRNYQESEYAAKYDRSLTSVLSENKLMPLKANYCFPNRQNIDKLIRGELVGDDEIIRKMLIFLAFYSFWAKLVISKNDNFYSAKPIDSERCLSTLNNRLLDAGYPELYAGNPYDWLFMWALNDEHPLDAFRHYIGEVFAVKEEQKDIEKCSCIDKTKH